MRCRICKFNMNLVFFGLHYCVNWFILGKPPGDDVKVGMLSLKPGMKIMMMGTAEENLVMTTIH